jgi:hypothetical protein
LESANKFPSSVQKYGSRDELFTARFSILRLSFKITKLLQSNVLRVPHAYRYHFVQFLGLYSSISHHLSYIKAFTKQHKNATRFSVSAFNIPHAAANFDAPVPES